MTVDYQQKGIPFEGPLHSRQSLLLLAQDNYGPISSSSDRANPHQQVLRLDVPVHHIQAVQVLEGGRQVAHQERGFFF